MAVQVVGLVPVQCLQVVDQQEVRTVGKLNFNHGNNNSLFVADASDDKLFSHLPNLNLEHLFFLALGPRQLATRMLMDRYDSFLFLFNPNYVLLLLLVLDSYLITFAIH